MARKKKNARITPIPERDIQINRQQKIEIVPRNTKQEEYLQYLTDYNKKVVFALGPAGTGKTLLATLQAIKLFKTGNINKLYITRPAVEVSGEKHGFLPGGIAEKMDPWVRPIFDVFEEYYSPKDLQKLIEENIIEISPLAYMRGRNFKNAIVLFDEAQNTTEEQMKCILTRIGENCRMFITGDVNQRDHKRNGLNDFLERYRGNEKSSIGLVEFNNDNIERSQIVKDILNVYGDEL